MLIGFDVYVDVEGNVGFYEGNSIPFAVGDYRGMFGSDLEKAIVSQLSGNKVVGINIDFSIEGGSPNYNGQVARDICESNGFKVVMADESTTEWDSKQKRLYFNTDDGRKDFDILFNRKPGAQKNLRERVPKQYWLSAPVISPIAHTMVLANKYRTGRAFKKFGIETPLAYVVKNDEERRIATKKIMRHISENHSSYIAPYILIKPISGTGARGISLLRDEKSEPQYDLRYPCLVTERITSAGIIESDGTHMVDTRMFYCGGHASHGIGRVAPNSIENAQEGEVEFRKDSYVTNLCQGGHAVRLETNVEKILNQYVLAAALAINEGTNEYMVGLLK
jgi:hypothetical protein